MDGISLRLMFSAEVEVREHGLPRTRPLLVRQGGREHVDAVSGDPADDQVAARLEADLGELLGLAVHLAPVGHSLGRVEVLGGGVATGRVGSQAHSHHHVALVHLAHEVDVGHAIDVGHDHVADDLERRRHELLDGRSVAAVADGQHRHVAKADREGGHRRCVPRRRPGPLRDLGSFDLAGPLSSAPRLVHGRPDRNASMYLGFTIA